MTPYLLCFLLGSAVPEPWMKALALVESGDNPRAVGRHGERTMYQVHPKVWRMHTKTPMHKAGPNMVRGIVKEEWSRRINLFEVKHKRKPTPREAYILWNAPSRLRNPSRLTKDTAVRFENLVTNNKP